MPIICSACQGLIGDDAVFCGFCGFRIAPLVMPAPAPILLTRVKRRQPDPPLMPPAPQAVKPSPAAAPPRAPAPAIPPTLVPQRPDDGAPAAAPRAPLVDRAPRFPLKVDVTYNSAHNFYTGFMENIGEGGLFIATHTPARIGDQLEVLFTVPGLKDACTVLCRVRWLREYDPLDADAVPGMGCQFGSLDPHVAAVIQAFIEHRDPIFYD